MVVAVRGECVRVGFGHHWLVASSIRMRWIAAATDCGGGAVALLHKITKA